MKRRDFLAGSAAAALAGVGLGGQQTGAAAASPPDILWIHMDDGRADALGCYDAPWARTPHLDALAARGVRFDQAIVQSPVCVPARRSLKTGHYVHEAGPMGMGDPVTPVPPYFDAARAARISEAPNLLDAFTAAGRQPVSLGKVHGYHASFDHRGDAPVLFNVVGNPTPYFRDRFGEDSPLLAAERFFTTTHRWQIGGVLDVPPEATETWRLGDMAVETLGALTATPDPFFLRVSFHAPHVACYVPPAYFIDPAGIDLPLPTDAELAAKPVFERGPLHTYSGADLTPAEIGICRGTYFGMVALMDVQVGRIMAALEASGRLANTVIAFTSDQGFQLGEQGPWKKRMHYDANVRVPLILAAPGRLPEGSVVADQVEHIDFLPTLLDLAGLSVPGGIRGQSLVPLIEGRGRGREATFCEIDHSESMYTELRGGGRRVMVRTDEWKLDAFLDPRQPDPDGSLYHLREDPGERVNQYGDPARADIVRELRAMAAAWDPTTALEGA